MGCGVVSAQLLSACSSLGSLPRLRTAVGAHLSPEPRGSSGSASILSSITTAAPPTHSTSSTIYCDFSDAIEAQKTMKPRPIIVIPILTRRSIYVSKAISEPGNETGGVVGVVGFRRRTACGLLVRVDGPELFGLFMLAPGPTLDIPPRPTKRAPKSEGAWGGQESNKWPLVPLSIRESF
jgi:hypothetical protein